MTMNDKELLRNRISDALIMKKLPKDVFISTMTVCCELDIEFKVKGIIGKSNRCVEPLNNKDGFVFVKSTTPELTILG